MNAASPDGVAIEFRDVQFRAPTGQAILETLSLQIQSGETLVLLGRSGSGKTTALAPDQSAARTNERQSDGRRPRHNRLERSRIAPPHRLRNSGRGPVPALHSRTKCRGSAASREVARRTRPRPRRRTPASRRPRRRPIRPPLSPRTLRRPAPARRSSPRASRRSAIPA